RGGIRETAARPSRPSSLLRAAWPSIPPGRSTLPIRGTTWCGRSTRRASSRLLQATAEKETGEMGARPHRRRFPRRLVSRSMVKGTSSSSTAATAACGWSRLTRLSRRSQLSPAIRRSANRQAHDASRMRVTKGILAAKCLAGAVSVLITAGCSSLAGSAARPHEVAARDMALSIADPVSGTTQELTDLGAFLYGSDIAKRLDGAPWSLFHAGDFALYFVEGIESGKFVWRSTTNDYELTETRSVAAGLISGSANISIDVAFFTSNNSNGPGISISDPSAGFPSTVRSLSYQR